LTFQEQAMRNKESKGKEAGRFFGLPFRHITSQENSLQSIQAGVLKKGSVAPRKKSVRIQQVLQVAQKETR
jgi:hypothetical protein